MDRWIDGWMDGWMDGQALLRQLVNRDDLRFSPCVDYVEEGTGH